MKRNYSWTQMAIAGVALNGLAQALGPTSAAKEEYARSTRPPFAPPAWAFGIAWPVNNALTLWANREVLNAPPSADRSAYLRLNAATWALFASYGLVRFRLRSPLLGYANTALYLALALASASRAYRIKKTLLLSYATLVPWLSFAMLLSTFQINDDDPVFER